jgi:hypothetical protein
VVVGLFRANPNSMARYRTRRWTLIAQEGGWKRIQSKESRRGSVVARRECIGHWMDHGEWHRRTTSPVVDVAGKRRQTSASRHAVVMPDALLNVLPQKSENKEGWEMLECRAAAAASGRRGRLRGSWTGAVFGECRWVGMAGRERGLQNSGGCGNCGEKWGRRCGLGAWRVVLVRGRAGVRVSSEVFGLRVRGVIAGYGSAVSVGSRFRGSCQKTREGGSPAGMRRVA